MIPFYVMVVAILVARTLGALGMAVLADWEMATRVGLAVMFVFTGLAHFGRTREDLIAMVPPVFPNPGLLVSLTGFAELLGAGGLLFRATAPLAAYGLIGLLIAMFPANIHASRIQHRIAGRPHTRMALRLPLQLLWILLLWWSVP